MKLIIILVGLPARGKSFISNKLNKYLNWCNIKTKIFNVGELRRQKYEFENSYFFDSSNTELNKIRLNISLELYDKLLEWILLDNNNIAIFDATNSDKNKRKLLYERTPKNTKHIFGGTKKESHRVCNKELDKKPGSSKQ